MNKCSKQLLLLGAKHQTFDMYFLMWLQHQTSGYGYHWCTHFTQVEMGLAWLYLELWARKVIELWRWGIMGQSCGVMEDKKARRITDSGDPSYEVSRKNKDSQELGWGPFLWYFGQESGCILPVSRELLCLKETDLFEEEMPGKDSIKTSAEQAAIIHCDEYVNCHLDKSWNRLGDGPF